MATIRASCDYRGSQNTACGDVEFNHAELTVIHYANSDTFGYRFRCPLCKVIQLKSAEYRTADLLIASGCELETIMIAYDGLSAHLLRTPVSDNDFIDFHEQLQSISSPDDVAQLWSRPTTDL